MAASPFIVAAALSFAPSPASRLAANISKSKMWANTLKPFGSRFLTDL
jgi:hypothetical protein